MRARLIILLALALLLASCADDDGGFPSTSTAAGSTTTSSADGPSTTLPGESSTTTTVALTTTTAGPVVESVWERIPRDSIDFGPDKLGMAGVVAGGPGLVAVGWSASMGGVAAAAWTSADDGLTWQRAAVEGPGLMQAVTVGGPGLVAAGYDSSGGDDDAAVWVSSDGLTWVRVPHDEAVFGGPGGEQIFGVAAGGLGLVAVGWGVVDGDEGAAVWGSADGYTWERIVDNTVLGGSGGQAMYAVVAGGPGLVAVGHDFLEGEWDAAVWTSPDGANWSRVPADAAVFGGPGTQEMRSVAIGGPGMVAVGNDYAEVAANGAVWTSPDGLAWTRVPHDPAVFGGPGNQEMLGVAAGSTGLAAVGRDDSGEAGDGAVWASADGLDWARVPEANIFGGPLYQEMLGITAGGPGLVAVGLERNPDGGEQHAVVWLNRPSE